MKTGKSSTALSFTTWAVNRLFLLVFLGELSLWLVIGEIDQLGARKDTCDCVVIFDRDGIKLVVVASSLSHSQTLKVRITVST